MRRSLLVLLTTTLLAGTAYAQDAAPGAAPAAAPVAATSNASPFGTFVQDPAFGPPVASTPDSKKNWGTHSDLRAADVNVDGVIDAGEYKPEFKKFDWDKDGTITPNEARRGAIVKKKPKPKPAPVIEPVIEETPMSSMPVEPIGEASPNAPASAPSSSVAPADTSTTLTPGTAPVAAPVAPAAPAVAPATPATPPVAPSAATPAPAPMLAPMPEAKPATPPAAPAGDMPALPPASETK